MLRPSADTGLFSTLPNNNLGLNTNLVCGANGSGFPSRALMRFDLAGQIPSNAVIQSAALTVTVVIIPGVGGGDPIFDLHRLLVDWGEGVGTGNSGTPANAGEATWNQRFHSSIPWSVPGGAVSNDYLGTVSSSVLFGGLGSYTFDSTPDMIGDVQKWLSDPGTNFGWMVVSESESTPFTARRFGSREDPTNAPVLSIQYTLPAPTQIEWIKADGNQVEFSFLALGGQPYTVQWRDSVTSGDWATLTNIGPQVVTTNLTVTDLFPTNAQRFYRVGVF